MPTVMRWNGYRFFWYQADGAEPPHVHIWKAGKECKIWIETGEIAFNRGHAAADSRTLIGAVAEYRPMLLEAWYEDFGR